MALSRPGLLFAWLWAATALPAAALATPDDVILAKSAPDVVVIWRINAFVREIAPRKLSDAGFSRALIAHGAAILAMEVAKEPAARTASLRLVYFHEENDPRYKIETLGGVDRVGAISADAATLARHAARWRQRLNRGDVPKEFHVELDRGVLAEVERPQPAP